MSHKEFLHPLQKSKHWEWKYMLRMWERWKDSGLQIMGIEFQSPKQGFREKRQLDFTPETVMCSGSHSLFETTPLCIYNALYSFKGRMYSLVSDRPGFETWLLWLWTDNFLNFSQPCCSHLCSRRQYLFQLRRLNEAICVAISNENCEDFFLSKEAALVHKAVMTELWKLPESSWDFRQEVFL